MGGRVDAGNGDGRMQIFATVHHFEADPNEASLFCFRNYGRELKELPPQSRCRTTGGDQGGDTTRKQAPRRRMSWSWRGSAVCYVVGVDGGGGIQYTVLLRNPFNQHWMEQSELVLPDSIIQRKVFPSRSITTKQGATWFRHRNLICGFLRMIACGWGSVPPTPRYYCPLLLPLCTISIYSENIIYVST